jgi:hypothetical protein
MGSIAEAITWVPRRELVLATGPNILERLALAVFERHRAVFAKPILDARSVDEVERHLRTHALRAVVSRAGITAFLLPLRVWSLISAHGLQAAYERIQASLRRSGFPDDVVQACDYVAYTSFGLGLSIAKAVRRHGGFVQAVRAVKVRPPRLRSVSAAEYDMLVESVFLAIEEPRLVQDFDVFRHVTERATAAVDAQVALFSSILTPDA